jgi:hypothetical protein
VSAILGLGMLAMIVADAAAGARLLWLARRTRQLPELALGSSLLLMGAVGYPLAVAARRGAFGADAPAAWILAGALAVQNLGCFGTFVLNWRVFRPGARWAAGLTGAGAAVLVASIAGPALAAGPAGPGDGGAWYYAGLAARAAGFAWAAVESLRYHGLMRRRLALGLADPVVTDRFRLWGIASAATVAGFGAFLAGRLAGPHMAESPPVLAATSCVGLVAATSLWLAFLPPAAYLRRLAARASR